MSDQKWPSYVRAVALSVGVVLLILGFAASNAAADDDKSDGVKVVQHFLTFSFAIADPGDSDPTTFRPVPPNPTCISSLVVSGTSGPPGDMTTLSPYLNENVEMFRADGSFIYTDFTKYTVSITGHGSGTFTALETQAKVDAAGTGSSENCVVPGSATGDLVGMTGCGRLTSDSSNQLGDIVWFLHFPGEHDHH